MKTLRLFISSPGDVGRERHATAEIIRRLQSEFAEHVTLDPYFWEWEPVDFSKDYQANIPSTADFDIVVCILWSRLGSRLSDQHKLPPDYTRPASSGTEYELLQALHGQHQHPDRLPDLLVWKNDSPPPPASAPPLSREEEDERIRQRRALQDFLTSVTRDANTGSFIAALNSYQYLDEFEDMMDKKLRKLIEKHIGQRSVKPKPQWQGSPFRDLDVFEFEHAPIFFGRSRAVGEVVRLLQNTLSKPQPCHFALILGASGSGKSSLARAGVLPLLTRPGVIEGIGLWRCAIVRPSDDSADLFQALAAALLRADKKMGAEKTDASICCPHFSVSHPCPPALPELADPESSHPQQSLAAELRAHPQTVAIRVKDQLNAVAKTHQTQQRHALEAQIASLTKEGRQADAALKQQAREQFQEPKARLVLLLDQMEELFTLNYAPEQLHAFLETIDVLARSGRVFVIGTLRSDFYPRYQEQPTLVALARDGARFDLLPPTPDEISQIIRRPASLAAFQFEPHPSTAEHTLADTLRDEALADTEALPLLEHVLNRLYQAQLPRADGRLTFADYEEICGVDLDPKTGVKTSRGVGGALGKHAEDIFIGQNLKPTDPPPPWTEDTFRAVFRCLVTFGKGEGDTDVPNRRAFTYQDLIRSDPAAQALVDIFIHERLLIADTDAQSRAIVSLSHEALLTRWPRLANWLQTAPVRDLMSQRRRLESSLRQWQEQNRTTDCYLQPGFELEEGKQLLEKHEAALKAEEREFIQRSQSYDEGIRRRRKLLVVGVVAVLITLLGNAWQQRTAAITARSDADARNGDLKLLLVKASRADCLIAQNLLDQQRGADAVAHLARAQDYVPESSFPSERAVATLNEMHFPTPLSILDLQGSVTFSADGRIFALTTGIENAPYTPDSQTAILKTFDTRIGGKLSETKLGQELSLNDGLNIRLRDEMYSSDGRWLIRFNSHGSDLARIWDTQTGKLTTRLAGNKSKITSVLFSPQSEHLAVICDDKTVKLWAVATGKLEAELIGHTSAINSAQFSADGHKIVTSSDDKTAKVWDSTTGRLLSTFEGHKEKVTSAQFVRSELYSGDENKVVTASADMTARLWDIADGKEIHVFKKDEKPASESPPAYGYQVQIPQPVYYIEPYSVKVSGDGQYILAGSRFSEIRVWEATSGKLLSILQGYTGDIVSAEFFTSIYTTCVVMRSSNTATIWDVKSGEMKAELKGHADYVTSVQCSPDGCYILTGSNDKTARVWDSTSGRIIKVLQGHASEVQEARFTLQGSRIVTVAPSHELGQVSIRIWDAPIIDREALIREQEGHGAADGLSGDEISDDHEHMLTLNSAGVAKVWDLKTNRSPTILNTPDNPVSKAEFDINGNFVLTQLNAEEAFQIWSRRTGKLLLQVNNENEAKKLESFGKTGGALLDLTPSEDRIFSISEDHIVRMWDSKSWELVATLGKADGSELQFSPDGRKLVTRPEVLPEQLPQHTTDSDIAALRASVGELPVKIWDTTGGALISSLEGSGSISVPLMFAPGGKCILEKKEPNRSVEAETVRVWNVASGKLISPFPKRVEFSPTGDRIVTISNDFSVHLWDAGGDNQIARLGDFEELPRQVVFSPDGQRFVIVTQDSLAQLWDASVGRLISVLKTESVNVVHAAFSPNGKLLGTASSDYNNTAHIWKALDGQFIAVLQGHEGSVKSIIFSSDGQRVLTCSEDNTTRMWSALSGKQLTVFEHHSANVERSEFSPNGRWVLSISDDSTARVWDSNSAQLVAKLSLPLENILRRPVAGRSLSLPEPETHFSSDSRCVIASVGGMAIQTWELLGAESSPPAWFSEFLRLLAQRKFDAEGNLVLMPTDEFMSTRSRVTRIVAKERSRYAAIARWFLASTEDRPARPAAN